MPDDFDEEKWLADLQVYLERPGLLADDAGGIAMLEKRGEERAMDGGGRRRRVGSTCVREILRRQAINLYVSQAKVRPVDPERLARFIAALPPWIQTSFDSLSPDEARQRLTFAYRLVFPRPEEIGATPQAGRREPSKARRARPPSAGPALGRRRSAKPAEAGAEAAPF